MTDLTKAMKKQYEYHLLGRSSRGNEEDLITLQKWAEQLILKKNGELTISDENEIKQNIDKLRAEQYDV
jgi:hypothetical protein